MTVTDFITLVRLAAQDCINMQMSTQFERGCRGSIAPPPSPCPERLLLISPLAVLEPAEVRRPRTARQAMAAHTHKRAREVRARRTRFIRKPARVKDVRDPLPFASVHAVGEVQALVVHFYLELHRRAARNRHRRYNNVGNAHIGVTRHHRYTL